jgi:hypothetical protein
MKKLVPIVFALALAVPSSAAFSQATINTDVNVRGGASVNAPGQKMQTRGSVRGTTGASGYAPGHKMQTRGSVRGTTGASGYAPGRIKGDVKGGADVNVNTRAR